MKQLELEKKELEKEVKDLKEQRKKREKNKTGEDSKIFQKIVEEVNKGYKFQRFLRHINFIEVSLYIIRIRINPSFTSTKLEDKMRKRLEEKLIELGRSDLISKFPLRWDGKRRKLKIGNG